MADNNEYTSQATLTAADDAITLSGQGFGAWSCQMTGTHSGTQVFEGSNDGSNWFSIYMTPPGSSAAVASVTANGQWVGSVAYSQFRVRRSVATSGSVAVTVCRLMMPVDPGAGGGGSLVAAAGDVAHDGVDSGNPVKVGAQARTSNPTAVANADRVNFIADKLGKQIVVGAIRELKGVQKTTITTSVAETTIVTAVASTFLDLYGLILANTSATIVTVTIRDTTGGSAIAIIEVPANDTRGFMLPVDTAIPQTTANTNWTAQGDASITSLEVTAFYVKNT